MKTLIPFLYAVSACAAAQMPSGPSRPTKSEFFTSQVAMVLVSQKSPESVFALTLSMNKALPPEAVVDVAFDNPADSEHAWHVAPKFDGGLLYAQSPKFAGISNKRAYLSVTTIRDRSGVVLSTHQQWIWFEMPSAMRSVYATKVLD